jgi:hypothetical protein
MPYRLSESMLEEVVDMLPDVFDSHDFERKAFQVFRDQFMDDSTSTGPSHVNHRTELLEQKLTALSMVELLRDESGNPRITQSENFLGETVQCSLWRKVEPPPPVDSSGLETAEG